MFQGFASYVLEALFVDCPEYGHGKSFRNINAYTPVRIASHPKKIDLVRNGCKFSISQITSIFLFIRCFYVKSLTTLLSNLFVKLTSLTNILGTADGGTVFKVRFQMVALEFFIDIILPIALWPWVRLSL
jgi:hypothetical protein